MEKIFKGLRVGGEGRRVHRDDGGYALREAMGLLRLRRMNWARMMKKRVYLKKKLYLC